jgi:hypothetical protein
MQGGAVFERPLLHVMKPLESPVFEDEAELHARRMGELHKAIEREHGRHLGVVTDVIRGTPLHSRACDSVRTDPGVVDPVNFIRRYGGKRTKSLFWDAHEIRARFPSSGDVCREFGARPRISSRSCGFHFVASSRRLDIDLLSLRAFGDWRRYGQQAIFEVGFDSVRIHFLREVNRSE